MTPHADPLPDPDLLNKLLRRAHSLADVARPLSLRAFRQAQTRWRKPDGSPVTGADRAVERRWRELLRQAHPDHGIVGEEFGSDGATAPWVWVLDPIDGTAAYACGHRGWGSLIALLHQGQPVLGLIDAPALNERWAAHCGTPALWWQGAAGPVSCTCAGTTDLAAARLSASLHVGSTPVQAQRLERLRQRVGLCHVGGDCLSHALLATGHIDLVAEAALEPFDYLALVPVITAAGGVITDWQGRSLALDGDGTVLSAANTALHVQALALLRAEP